MYKIALVQNQSEMAHYGYADAQPFLDSLGYDTTLFTAQNISLLHGNLSSSFDAIILASNSMNDKTIRHQLTEGRVCKAIGKLLSNGAGLLCLSQLGTASTDDSLSAQFPFLPTANEKLLAGSVRPLAEATTLGVINNPVGASGHLLLHYPNLVNLDLLQQGANTFRNLPGLYWHFWSGVSLESWETVLVDDGQAGDPRPLLVASKQSLDHRLVFSALALDWQRQDKLLENLVRYVVEGHQSTAILFNRISNSPSFAYFLASLNSRRFPYRNYPSDNADDMDSLAKYIKDGIHSTLVLAPELDIKVLPQTLLEVVRAAIGSGTLGVVQFAAGEEAFPFESIRTTSYRRFVLPLLQEMEIGIQSELRSGYVDGSFWSTVEVLQTLEQLSDASRNYRDLVGATISRIESHDREGSYDGVFGATCAALWLKATFLGIEDSATQKTASWVRNVLTRYEYREQALALTTFRNGCLGVAEDIKLASEIIESVLSEELTQTDLIAYLRTAYAFGLAQYYVPLLERLCDIHAKQGWLDLATAAEAAGIVQDTWYVLLGDEDASKLLSERIELRVTNLVYTTIIFIQDSLDLRRGNRGYPWDGKASTAVKCISAWLKFDARLELPVYDAIAVLEDAAGVAKLSLSNTTALAVLDELKYENSHLRTLNADLQVVLDEARTMEMLHRRTRLARRLLLWGSITLLYLLVTIVIASFVEVHHRSASDLYHAAFVTPIVFHIGVLALVAAYAVLPWKRLLERD